MSTNVDTVRQLARFLSKHFAHSVAAHLITTCLIMVGNISVKHLKLFISFATHAFHCADVDGNLIQSSVISNCVQPNCLYVYLSEAPAPFTVTIAMAMNMKHNRILF